MFDDNWDGAPHVDDLASDSCLGALLDLDGVHCFAHIKGFEEASGRSEAAGIKHGMLGVVDLVHDGIKVRVDDSGVLEDPVLSEDPFLIDQRQVLVSPGINLTFEPLRVHVFELQAYHMGIPQGLCDVLVVVPDGSLTQNDHLVPMVVKGRHILKSSNAAVSGIEHGRESRTELVLVRWHWLIVDVNVH